MFVEFDNDKLFDKALNQQLDSVLLFDFQSDNPEFLIRMENGKRRELIYKEHCAEAGAGITFLHRLSTKTDTKKQNASEAG